MDVRRADLHTHTTASDGKLSPSDLVKKAQGRGLTAVAVTDHDTIDGLSEAVVVGDTIGMEIIPGVELSVTVAGQEIHLLGYYFDPSHSRLTAHLAAFRERRAERGRQIVILLNRLGLRLDMEDVLVHAEDGVVGRPHIAQALVATGQVVSYEDAFERYLKDFGPAYVAKPVFPASDAVSMLHEAGGLASLAHPGSRIDGRSMKQLIRAGIDAVETIHPSHSPALTDRYKDLARKYGLIETGGSDYHGFRPEEDDNLLRYSVPYGRLEMMRRAAA